MAHCVRRVLRARARSWYDPDYNNVGPRVGFAWSPARFNDNTVIRGGFGVFFGPGQNDDVFAPIDNAGARTTLTQGGGAAACPIRSTRSSVSPPALGNAARAVDENRVDQYAEHYSLTIQQALPWRPDHPDRLSRATRRTTCSIATT